MSYTKQESLVEFDGWSRTYDASILQRILFVPSHDYLMSAISDGEQRPVRALDIGCGTGVFARRMAATYRDAEVWGVDFSGQMVGQAAARTSGSAPTIRYVQADSESLPLASNSFDVITCSNSFHHYPNQAAAVHEMYRVLRPGGRLLIIDGYRDRLWGRFIFDVCVVAMEGEVHHASARRFRELFHGAGFTSVRQQARLGLAPFLLTIGTAHKGSAMSMPTTQSPRIAA